METMSHLKNVLESVNNPWEGVQESFQFKWLRKFLSVSELKLKLKAWISLFCAIKFRDFYLREY